MLLQPPALRVWSETLYVPCSANSCDGFWLASCVASAKSQAHSRIGPLVAEPVKATVSGFVPECGV